MTQRAARASARQSRVTLTATTQRASTARQATVTQSTISQRAFTARQATATHCATKQPAFTDLQATVTQSTISQRAFTALQATATQCATKQRAFEARHATDMMNTTTQRTSTSRHAPEMLPTTTQRASSTRQAPVMLPTTAQQAYTARQASVTQSRMTQRAFTARQATATQSTPTQRSFTARHASDIMTTSTQRTSTSRQAFATQSATTQRAATATARQTRVTQTTTTQRHTGASSATTQPIGRKWVNVNLHPPDVNTRPAEPRKMKPRADLLDMTPAQLFLEVWDHKIMDHICRESVKYAVSRGYVDIEISVNDIQSYLAVLLLSGYADLPSRRMYWETKSDVYNHLVAENMPRNKFDLIHRIIHFNDNANIDKNDKVYKVRPIINHLNKKFVDMIEEKGDEFSLDETMEPYFGRHSLKQFIRGKPIRFGFRKWCLATSDGYLLKFSVYTGKSDRAPGTPLRAAETETMCVNFLPCTLYIDNFFTSLRLLETLATENIRCVGTIGKDCVEKAPLQDLTKAPRGSYHALRDEKSGVILARWHDNSQVTMASNILDVESEKVVTCQRWNVKERKHVAVKQPYLVKMYNRGMGGVDLFDQQRGLYRISIRSNKWYWPIFRFCLNASVVNTWMIYRVKHPKCSLLQFLRTLVISLLETPAAAHLRPCRPRTHNQIGDESRFHRTDHLVDTSPTQRRCAQCKKNAKFICVKCNVALHPHTCFRLYHTK
jgi:hypothetical protein